MIALARWPFARVDTKAPIRTARLLLRTATIEDTPRIAELAGDWNVASMTARIPYPYTRADAHQWLETLVEGEVVFVVECEATLVGMTGYQPAADRRSAEIGYWIGKPYWGRGFATEAARAIVSTAFSRSGLAHLDCCHFVDNEGSRRVVEKLGFSRLGPGSCYCEARRRDVATERYRLLRPTSWRRRPAA